MTKTAPLRLSLRVPRCLSRRVQFLQVVGDMIFVIQTNFRLGTIKEVITSCSMFCYTFVKVLKEYDTLSGPCSGSTVFIMMEAERTDKTENCLVRYAGLLRQIATRSRPYKPPRQLFLVQKFSRCTLLALPLCSVILHSHPKGNQSLTSRRITAPLKDNSTLGGVSVNPVLPFSTTLCPQGILTARLHIRMSHQLCL